MGGERERSESENIHQIPQKCCALGQSYRTTDNCVNSVVLQCPDCWTWRTAAQRSVNGMAKRMATFRGQFILEEIHR